MKYVVLGITSLLFALAGAAIVFGITLGGRAIAQLTQYERVMAEEVYLPGDGFGQDPYGEHCWRRARYRVGDQTFMAPQGCAALTPERGIRLRYNKSNPAESIKDEVSELIARAIRWIAFGGALGWCASTLRARSTALTGRAASYRQWGSGAWGLLALLGFSVAAARDIADVREGFCGNRRQMLSNTVTDALLDHERRFPRQWFEIFQRYIDHDARLSGSPECLAVTTLDQLVPACSDGFHITGEMDVGSPVCEWSGFSRYKVDLEILTDRKWQTINLRYPEVP